jgi:hypothetical protein
MCTRFPKGIAYQVIGGQSVSQQLRDLHMKAKDMSEP